MTAAPEREDRCEQARSDLYAEQGQSPWLDNLRRDWLREAGWPSSSPAGVRGVTSNPTIFAKAIAGEDDYDEQFALAARDRAAIEDAYWELVIDDIVDALGRARGRSTTRASGADGFVSLEVAPALAHDTDGTVSMARVAARAHRPPQPAREGPGHRRGRRRRSGELIGEGRSINVTLIFGLERYDEVMEAYLVRARGLRAAGARRPLRGGQRGLVLREPGRHRGRPAPRDAGRRGHRATASSSSLRGQAAVAQAQGPTSTSWPRSAGPAGRRWRQGGPGAAPAVGVDVDQEPRLPRPALRRHAHRARHGQHDARGHARGLPDHGTVGADRRRRPRRAAAGSWPARRGRASTWRTSPRRSRTRGCTPSPSPSTSCSRRSRDKASRARAALHVSVAAAELAARLLGPRRRACGRSTTCRRTASGGSRCPVRWPTRPRTSPLGGRDRPVERRPARHGRLLARAGGARGGPCDRAGGARSAPGRLRHHRPDHRRWRSTSPTPSCSCPPSRGRRSSPTSCSSTHGRVLPDGSRYAAITDPGTPLAGWPGSGGSGGSSRTDPTSAGATRCSRTSAWCRPP